MKWFNVMWHCVGIGPIVQATAVDDPRVWGRVTAAENTCKASTS